MKVCLLLLVGTLALVNADHDDCDPIAADNELNKDNQPGQQVIYQKDFYDVPRTTYFTTQATKYDGISQENKSCSAVSHDETKCGAVTYERWFAQTYKPRDEGFKGVKMHTVWWSVNTLTKSLIKFSMDLVGMNRDDYIIQKDSNSQLTAEEYEIGPDGPVKKAASVVTEVATVLGSKFALYRASLTEGWGVFATCDGKRIWSAISEKGLKGDLVQIKKEINTYIANLKEAIKVHLKVTDPIVLHEVPTEIPDPYDDLLAAAKAN